MSDSTKKPGPAAMFSNYAEFAKAWANAPLRTGAIAPSSRALAREMAFAGAPAAGTRVVELGPGTGIVTEALLEYGVREQDLVLVELNPDFASALQARYRSATVLMDDAFDAVRALGKRSEPVSAVISSLPLLVHPHRRRVDLLEEALDLADPFGRFVQFTYGLVAPVRPPAKLRAMRSRRVWGNVPPATVWTYQHRMAACDRMPSQQKVPAGQGK